MTNLPNFMFGKMQVELSRTAILDLMLNDCILGVVGDLFLDKSDHSFRCLLEFPYCTSCAPWTRFIHSFVEY